MTRKIRAKVIGKWIKKGWIFKERSMLSLEFIDNNMDPRYYDLPVPRAYWHASKLGDFIEITMEFNKDDGLWYPV